MPTQRVAIIGAGPAGLTVALAARALGLDVTLYEQAPHFDPIGGGLLLHSNGLRVLDALGLLDEFAPLMRFIPLMILEQTDGKRLFTLDYHTLDIPHAHGAVIMRHTLEDRLLRTVQQAGVPVLFDHCLTEAAITDRGVRLRFAHGQEAEAAVVIACDGVHSRTRRVFRVPAQERLTGEAFLRGTGLVGVRDSILREIWAPDGQVFGICPLPGAQTHFYCSVPKGRWPDIRQNHPASWLNGWEAFGPEAAAIVQAVPDWDEVNYSETAEVRLRRWAFPPVFFVGDAAHAMRPNLGQGANAAMVDAFVLTRLLAQALHSGGSLFRAGRTYEYLRRPFVTQTQGVARAIGHFTQWKSPPARLLRDLLLFFPHRVDWFRQRGARLTAGYNPREDEYLTGPLAPKSGE